ncbi:MAG: carbon-nitrogen hydrolase family protein [Ruminiclostridium sp.]
MSLFKVALLQLVQSEIQSDNLDKGIRFCKEAKKMGADIAVFPEMWNIGYVFPKDGASVEEWKQKAINLDDEFIIIFKNLAKSLDIAIAITYLEKWPTLPRNTVTIIDRHGKCILTYAKVHTCDFGNESLCIPGDNFYTCELDTQCGYVKVGSMICYDREFPESARILMLKGAEIILVPNACDIEENRRCQLKTRAFENMVGIAMTNYAIGKDNCNGHSLAYDGVAFHEISPDIYVSRDMLIVEAGEAEGIYIAEFDMDKIREYRRRECWGNSYRKPGKYSMLVSEQKEEPFIRRDSR